MVFCGIGFGVTADEWYPDMNTTGASTAGFVLPSGKDGQPAKMIAKQPSGCEDWERALDERDRSKPFFMWMAALDPHREYTAGSLDPPHLVQDVIVPPHLPDTPAVREDLRLYSDEIASRVRVWRRSLA